MKIIIRTLILLVAALVVVGITMTLQSAGLLASVDNPDGFERRPPAGFVEGAAAPGAFTPRGEGEGMRPDGFGGRHERSGDHHGGGRGDMFNPSELVKNMVITTVIIAVFVLLSRALRTLRPQRRSL